MAYKKLKYWFDEELAELLARKIIDTGQYFDQKSFVHTVCQQIPKLELKARIQVFAEALHYHLSGNYAEDVALIKNMLGPENPNETGMFKEYYWVLPLAKYVELYGLSNWSISMDIIEEITKRSTAEYAIRPFIERHPKTTLEQMRQWSLSPNFHVRRLAVEGCRPRLPWAPIIKSLQANPSPILPILENLKDDSSKYVQKSVANQLNDFFKDHPPLAVEIIEDWIPTASTDRKWIIKHALRNQLKKDDAWAMSVIKRL